MKYVSVAVDGPAGSGKSTITKMVAKSLGFNYVDTGAMYRALTFNFLSNGLDELEEEEIKELLSKTDFKVEYVDGVQYVYVNNEEVSDKIRTAEVSKFTSLFAKSPAVRDFLIDTQRNLANTNNIIMDGRDIASVVLPNADVKIFLTASVEERARRRVLDFERQGIENVDFEKVKEDIKARDWQDENRDIAPLIKVESATLIDTTSLTINEVVEKMTELVKSVEK
ncbi:(d)CMP kinase [Gemella haemolysans]|uniref:Cytidylate kinase n=1 Tax=Gemella haemolysans ATCC 10379 TaxID=546270 RepID=C5NYW7_9BACL|nr:(d)CMP kinase [Gemella haemolysans]EER67869.1 cytidylate kinase [Gemella haemolysans ATCC 10379]KAA8709456.1 (d)CMP kinase [Gemella haemolysans]UBH83155.1 (d)CMP kinase [Gemella haemolysans]VEI38568.1 Cytidylate kinase [Gemella haemolysans]